MTQAALTRQHTAYDTHAPSRNGVYTLIGAKLPHPDTRYALMVRPRTAPLPSGGLLIAARGGGRAGRQRELKGENGAQSDFFISKGLTEDSATAPSKPVD